MEQLTSSETSHSAIALAADADDTGDAHPRDGKGRKRQEALIDVLYENQRGGWLCGLPLFSSASLLQFDPAPWLNAHGRATAVDVTNAQTPDPTWQWAWPTWYVDMSQDVDEEGWQYSLMFRRNASWHASHPWFHSFVRRRRWIRKRVKVSARHATDLPSEGRKGRPDEHRLNADYFTIHPAKYAKNTASSIAPSTAVSNTIMQQPREEEPEELDSMAAMLRAVRRAAVDREKINLVLRFLDEGGEDVYYLADEMAHILSLFMFQYTRRQLLQRMLQKITAASEHRDQHAEREEPESAGEKQRIDSLLHAVQAAEKQVQSLEYWSDIRSMVQKGETFSGADEAEGWGHGWPGLDASGPSRAGMAPGDAAAARR